MTSLPTGTVAFLMSDIEGSTRLIRVVGAGYPQLLDDHLRLMREAIGGHGGTLVSTEGDSVFAVFPSVREAVSAAVEAERALDAHPWPTEATVRVRIGLNAGEAILGVAGDNYTGLEVHRTARIMAAAWGGQVLLSDAARALAGWEAPEGVGFRDLGAHQLRDMPGPEHLHQLKAPGLREDFPQPRTLSVTTPTNLPATLTRFVGRTREVEEVRTLLQTHRLVTLTGPGGSGKTRLSIETARTLVNDYPDGAWFVALDAVRDPGLVIPTMAHTLGLAEQPGRPLSELLAERLADQRTLLVLDNLEQVVEAAANIVGLLQMTTSLAILASSREPLSVAGEQVYYVPPLGVPAGPAHPTAADVEGAGSIELFVDRARAARSDFALTDENAGTIAAICRRLDGLPLALELAAARVNVLAVDDILARLEQRLNLLASSRRDLPDRQRTLRGAIDWSYELLTEPECVLFRRCSVFTGGMDLDAIEAVVDPGHELPGSALDLAATLVDRSLLVSIQDGGVARLAMLETIREYAAERLATAGETADLEARHAEYYATMAEAAETVMVDPRRDEILDRLDRELGNFRAAIAWSLRTGNTDTGLRLATSLNDFWHLRNHIDEAVRALDALVAASADDGDTLLRGRGLLIGAGLLTWLGEGARSLGLAEAGIAIAEKVGDLRGVAMGKSSVGWSIFYTEPKVALEMFEDGIKAARAVDFGPMEMESLMGQGWTYLLLGRPDEALGRAAEVLELGDRVGASYLTTFALLTQGIVAAERGDIDAALELFGESLRRGHGAGAHIGTALGLDAFATVALDRGDVDRGIQLAAVADRLRREIGSYISFRELGREAPLERARAMAAEADFERVAEQGRELAVDEAVAMALDDARG